MRITVKRQDMTPARTIGRMSIDGEPFCWVLEDAVRAGPKVYGKTAIPPGTYAVRLTWSPRFQRVLPLLEDVPGFEGVRIHPGNTELDTEGCILVGMGRTADAITESRKAFNALMLRLEKESSITLEIA